MTDRFYPKPGRYFAALTPERPIFQGDVFRGAFGAFWRHPEAERASVAGDPSPTSPPFPEMRDLRDSTHIRGLGYGMLLPNLCEYSEEEKGAVHPFRLVAPLIPLDSRAGVDHALVRAGRVAHTVWVPRWTKSGPQDYFVDLRYTASIDAAFIRRDTRVAALSRSAWAALADRLSRYFVGLPLDVVKFTLKQATLHPDAAT